MLHDVFISYSTRNAAEAKLFLETLETVNIRCWMAPRDIPPGKPWAGAINRAIKDCSVFLLMLTEDSNTSNQVLNEVVLASQHKKPIVACFLQKLELSDDLGYYLTSLHWLDASSLPLSAHLPGLVMTVRNLLQTSTGAPIPAAVEEALSKPSTQPPAEATPQVQSVSVQVIQPTPSAPIVPPAATGQTRVREKDGMTQVFVPAGEFLMGANDLGSDDHKPQHTVYLDSFWIDQTPVTNVQFLRFLNEQSKNIGYNPEFGRIKQENGLWRVQQGFEQHPVVSVNWLGASAYAEWVEARLPTEAQWEKSARGSDGRTWVWGKQNPDITLGNFAGGPGITTPVGNYPAGVSPYGALDMAGNVWEWCSDWYDAAYYAHRPDWRNPVGPSGGRDRVLRGGAFDFFAHFSACANRYKALPYYFGVSMGFRCCGVSL